MYPSNEVMRQQQNNLMQKQARLIEEGAIIADEREDSFRRDNVFENNISQSSEHRQMSEGEDDSDSLPTKQAIHERIVEEEEEGVKEPDAIN